jgi:hypothetical protein
VQPQLTNALPFQQHPVVVPAGQQVHPADAKEWSAARGFPLKLEIGAIDWPDLVAAGRAVHTVLGHTPVSQVVELIRADLP